MWKKKARNGQLTPLLYDYINYITYKQRSREAPVNYRLVGRPYIRATLYPQFISTKKTLTYYVRLVDLYVLFQFRDLDVLYQVKILKCLKMDPFNYTRLSIKKLF